MFIVIWNGFASEFLIFLPQNTSLGAGIFVCCIPNIVFNAFIKACQQESCSNVLKFVRYREERCFRSSSKHGSPRLGTILRVRPSSPGIHSSSPKAGSPESRDCSSSSLPFPVLSSYVPGFLVVTSLGYILGFLFSMTSTHYNYDCDLHTTFLKKSCLLVFWVSEDWNKKQRVITM